MTIITVTTITTLTTSTNMGITIMSMSTTWPTVRPPWALTGKLLRWSRMYCAKTI